MPLAPRRTLRIPSRYSVQFDGVDDYVKAPRLTPTRVTAEAWVKVSDVAGHPYGQIIVSSGDISRDFTLFLSGGNFAFLVRTSTHIYIRVGVTPTPGVWYHAAGTYDGNAIKIYVDGELKGDTSQTGDIGPYYSNEFIGVGAEGQSGGGDWGFFNGLIAKVLIYNRALSADEIVWNYNNFYNPVRDGLVLCLIADPQYIKDIDGDGILEWIDLSGYNNTGKIYGATLVDLYKSPVRTLSAARVMLVAR